MVKKSRVVDPKEKVKIKQVQYTASYKVSRSNELLLFLLEKCNMSRNNVKSLLTNRKVLVNGTVVSQYNFPLCKDDEVKIAKEPQDRTFERTLKKNKSNEKPIDLEIIYEDEYFIAINKPCGLLSVESDKERENAYSYVTEYMTKKDKNNRPFGLHRIDKETSGVLVFAKDIKLHSMLKMHWNEDIIEREYFALVEGTFKEKTGTITSYLKENQNNLVYSSNDKKNGKKAVTHYEVLKENEEYSLLRVKIDTGRKNQIRVHMKDMGHMIVGDDKYGSEKNPIGRLGLHASMLKFMNPITKEIVTIKAPVPKEFQI